jgi:hypothetical protein
MVSCRRWYVLGYAMKKNTEEEKNVYVVFKGNICGSAALQRHNNENLKQISPEKELRGLCPNFPHSCVCERIIYYHDGSAYSAAGKYVDQSWEYINRSQTHECGIWD